MRSRSMRALGRLREALGEGFEERRRRRRTRARAASAGTALAVAAGTVVVLGSGGGETVGPPPPATYRMVAQRTVNTGRNAPRTERGTDPRFNVPVGTVMYSLTCVVTKLVDRPGQR